MLRGRRVLRAFAEGSRLTQAAPPSQEGTRSGDELTEIGLPIPESLKKGLPNKKYEAPGKAKIPGTVEPLKAPPKAPVSKPPRPKEPVNQRLINLSGKPASSSDAEAFNEFITRLELSTSFEIRELIYLAIHNFKQRVRLGLLRPLNPQFLKLQEELRQKITSLLGKRKCDEGFDVALERLNFQNFPEREHIQRIRTHLNSEAVESFAGKIAVNLAMFDLNLEKASAEEPKDRGVRESPLRIYDIFQKNVSQHFLQPEAQVESNWVYIYGLPYAFDLSEVLSRACLSLSIEGQVEEAHGVQYKNFVERPDKLSKLLLSVNAEDSSEKLGQIVGGRQLEAASRLLKPAPDSKPVPAYYLREQKGMSFSEKMMKMEDHTFDKSYVLLKFRDRRMKQDFLTHELRIFGVTIDKSTWRCEDADLKKTIKVFNLPSGLSAQHFLDELNPVLEASGVAPFELKGINPTKIFDQPTALLTFACFEDSLKALEALQGFELRGNPLRVSHNYGGALFINGQYKDVPEALVKASFDQMMQDNVSAARSTFARKMAGRRDAPAVGFDFNTLVF